LNLMASNQARAIAAFEVASRYLSASMQLLPPDSWQHQYTLTLEIYTAAAEVALLNGNLSRAEKLTVIAEAKARTLLKRCQTYSGSSSCSFPQ
jgi:predicted ATPase